MTMKASAWSATESAVWPGVLATGTCRAEAADTATLTGPPRAQQISRSAGAAASTSSVTGAPWTMRISASPTRAAIWAGLPRYSRIEHSEAVTGVNGCDSSSCRYSSRWPPLTPASPCSNTGTGTNESPTTRIFMLGFSAGSGINPARLQIDGVARPRFHDHLEHGFGVEVVEADRLTDPALHHDLGPEVGEVAFGRVRFRRSRAHDRDVVKAFAVGVEPFLIYAGSLVG